MKKYIKILLLSASFALFIVEANSQTKPTRSTKKVKTKEELPPEPPPAMEELKEVRIDVDTSSRGRRVADESVGLELPPIDFDTTAVPDDQFSKDVLKLLEVTNAMNMGMQLANALTEEKDESMKEFYARFLKDIKEGTSRRWMNRMYIRTYRQRFTHEEVKELIRFYETPVGKKLINQTMEMLPGIMQQGKSIGAYQGMKIYMEMMKEKR